MKAVFSWEKPSITIKHRSPGSIARITFGSGSPSAESQARTQAGGISPNRFTFGSGSPGHARIPSGFRLHGLVNITETTRANTQTLLQSFNPGQI